MFEKHFAAWTADNSIVPYAAYWALEDYIGLQPNFEDAVVTAVRNNDSDRFNPSPATTGGLAILGS